MKEHFHDVSGIVVPGGFGERAVEGKIGAIKYARENNIPFLGLCLGMQMATVEFARNVCNLEGANSTEMDADTKYPIIDYLPEQYEGINMGGTLRLGLYNCKIKEGSLAHNAYKKIDIKERHRHRYEVDISYKEKLSREDISIEEFKEKLSLKNKYKDINLFRLRVLDVITKEINDYTDMIISYDLIKEGRAYSKIRFDFDYKNKPLITNQTDHDDESNNLFDFDFPFLICL